MDIANNRLSGTNMNHILLSLINSASLATFHDIYLGQNYFGISKLRETLAAFIDQAPNLVVLALDLQLQQRKIRVDVYADRPPKEDDEEDENSK